MTAFLSQTTAVLGAQCSLLRARNALALASILINADDRQFVPGTAHGALSTEHKAQP
jgi:hypothetical protein